MSSELELMKQCITELEAENVEIAELRKENAELRKENIEISNLRIKLSVSDAEIAELKRRNAEFLRANKEYNKRHNAKVNKLEQKNKELETRLAIVEQASLPVEEQSYNNNPSDDSTSNFNSVAEYHEKPLVDVETDNSFPEEKEMDNFLLEAYKKIVISEIKQRNKEKKFLRESAKNQVQDITSDDIETINNSKLSCDKKTVTIGNDQDSKLSRDKKTVTNGNDQDLELSLGTGDDISASLSLINERV